MGYQYALFDTPLGTCGIAWSDRGIRRLHLPEATREATERKLLSGLGQPATSAAPPAPVRRVLERVAQHLSGAPQDFADLLLDLDAVPPFHRKVYEVALAAPSGRTLTYGEVARLAGSPGASRAVGQALAKNPLPILVPCHRVLAAGNRPGGFTAFGGTDTKARLLGMEGVALPVHPSERPLPFDWDEAVRTLSRADPRLSRLMREVGPVRLTLRPPQSPFESLAQSIVYQQLSGKAAATILGRVRGLFPRKKLTAKGLLGLSDEQLRSAGLSRPKMLAMRDLAAKALDGTVPRAAELEKLSDEALIERLTRVRGIGQWTVEMILIFRLGRPDVLPVNDLGVRKGFAITYGGELPAPKALHELGERWRPFRTVASWFFWRATELPQEAREKLARERPARQKPGRSTPGRTGGSAA